MAANIPQMGGGGPIARRPQTQQQLSQLIYSSIMQQQISNTGWQSSVPPSMRVGHAMNVITNSFLAMPQADSAQILGVGLTYERDAFTSSPDKITYEQRILTRVNELFKKRQANEQNIHHSLTAQAQNQAQMMLNQNMQMRGMSQPMQQSFQSLQQQSPINQQGQPGIGVNNPNNLPMNPNQQPMQMGAQMRPQMAMQPGASTLPAQDRVKINQLAIAKFNSIPEPNRSQYRAAVQQKFGPQVMAQLQQEGIDPLLYFFQSQVQSQIMQSASKAQAGVNQPGMPMQAHQQRLMNQPAQQLPTGPNGEFGPFANVESIMNQQKAGLMAQEAGQTVVPASNGAGRNVTPQPVGSMPGSNQGVGQPTLQHQLPQQFNHQPAQQLKMDQRAAQTQAQIRAQAQAKQMQGQPGGLNGPGGASQSPGMNTLNAPVRRAPMGVGQTEGHPPIGQNNVPFGQHMMDPRFSQTGQRTPMGPNGNMNRNQVLHNILAQMPVETRQQIMNLPQDKVPEMIMRWNASRGAAMPGRPQPQMGQLTPGNPMAQSLTQFAPGNNQLGQHPNLNMSMNQQNQMIMQQQMNKLRNPNAPQGPLDRTALMDNMVVPLRVLEQLRLVSQPGGASPEIKKWGQLKQLLAQKNPSQQTVQGLLNVQNAQFQSYLKTNPGLVAAGSQPPQPNLSQQGIHPNGQPTPQMGQSTPNITGSSPNITISSHELQNARSHEKFKNWSDEKIRQMLTQVKLQALKNRAGPQAQMPQVSQPGQQATVPAVQSTSGAAMPPQRPPNVSAETTTASPVVQGRNTKQPPNNHAAAGAATAPTAKTGTKRPIPDDIAEGPNPSRTPIQRPHPQQPHATPQMPHFSPDQLAAMTPDQRQKYEAVMKSRQIASTGQIPEDMMRLKAIGQEQFQMAVKEQLPDIPMTPEQYQDTAQKVQAMCGEMNKISKIVGRWYSATHDDARAALFFKLRMRLFRQYVDGEKMSVLKDKFSITAADLDSISSMLQSFAKDISTYFPSMRKNPSQQSAPEPAAPQGSSTRPGAPTTQPTPLSAANLEKQTQALIKMQARTNGKGGQPPAAPTNAHPPFPFGAQSPDGRPTYVGVPAVTQESLQLPARKRPKTEPKAGASSSQNGSNANANASPQVQKMSSPELNKRQAVAEPRQAPKFTCSDQYCEFRSIGFPAEEMLRKHTDEEHNKPAEDPVKFAADSLAEVLGLDANGKVKKTPTTGGNIQSPVDISKHIQTPTTRAEAPMQRQGSATGSKSNELVKTIAGKASTPKLDPGSKSLDSSTPAATANGGTSLQVAGGEPIGTTIDPQELLSGVTGLEMGGDGAILDMNVYRSITPNDTPESSKDSASSEPNSDVSEGVALNMTLDMGFGTWDPFALGHDGPNLDMGNIDMPGLPYTGFSWDEVNPDFDKPFALDTSLFSLDAS